MAQLLKQSTAVDVLIGPFVDLTDGYTAETGESPTVKLSKNGQALAAKNDATTPTSDADGYYNCELDATDTNTLGTLVLTVAASATALPVRHEYMVVPANAYDSLVGGSDTLDANVTQWLGTAAATPTTAGVPEVDVTFVSGTAQTAGDLAALVTTVDTVVDSILVDTAEIGAAGAGLTAVPWNAAWDAEVQSEVDDALVAQGLDHLVNAAVVGADVTDNSIVAKLVSASATADWDDFVNTTDSLQAVRDQGDSAWITATGFSTHAAADVWTEATRTLTANTNLNDPTAAAIADAVLDEALSGHTTAGSLGKAVADIETDATAILADTGTDGVVIAAAQTVATVTDVTNQVTADVTAISGSSPAADNLEASALAIVSSAVNDASATTTSFVTDLTEATDDHFNGRILHFTSGALAGQSSDITDYAGGTKTVTVTALTEAPADNDTFVIT